ncbi:AAA family ATPase [Candidatus Azambacteria bacterium]|nr:AAA family ATPase [Candidatus Azambacteria bacterium]
MFLKKLELHGFKSFASSTVLEFKRGVSAIVGPNGSGKSNVADALRFVLGEQSMKSIRSKKGEDLIFSGSPSKPRAGMASVTLLFDNEDRTFPVEFGTVAIKRTIYRDGENHYFVNEAQVRLKDLAELIAKAKLGLKGYTIINQGMGDAILDSSPKDRKEIIFEALGLKEFQLKRSEALLKLSHTQVNLEKAEGIVKEIEPHLKFLKRQAEKMEERQGIEEKLKKLEVAYVAKRMRALETNLGQMRAKEAHNEGRIADIRLTLEGVARSIEKEDGEVAGSFAGVTHLEDSLMKEEAVRNAIEREIGKIEGMLAAAKRDVTAYAVAAPDLSKSVAIGNKSQSSEAMRVVVDAAYVQRAMEKLHHNLSALLGEATYEGVRKKLDAFAREFSQLFESVKTGKAFSHVQQEKNMDNSMQFENEQKRLADLLKKSDERLKEIKEEIKRIQSMHSKKREHIFELKNTKREKEMELRHTEEGFATLKAEIAHADTEMDVLKAEKTFLQSKGGVFLIEDALPHSVADEEIRTNIERMKIRLENIDLIDSNVGREYEETRKRYDFLTKESEDLRQAISSFHSVVAELDDMISTRFREAFKKINENFDAYFKLLFDGGRARLELVQEEREHEEGEMEAQSEARKNDGVEIEVSLPRKKTTGLSVLSGGERALTSLALLFALVSTSPPPFLVLDEIDAPLDEANSVRFGKILTQLKDHTQFVVITHNRETMRQADILYGVTMQEDGISKLLSLKFEAAKEIAQ